MSAELHRYDAAAAPHLRAMQESDLDQVADIEAEAYPYPWSRGIFRDCLRAGYGCWVLQHDDALIGYGVLSVAAGEAHVLNVCISPRHQGEGHGRQMMRRLVELARWERADRLYLEVRPSNHRAIALYESLGFRLIGRRPRYYPSADGREDALVMARALADEAG